MTALVVTVFLASIMGSLHCAGMCGAFMLFAVGADREGARRTPLHVLYHIGRLTTYVTLGLVAGALGSFVDLGGDALGVERLAAMVAGSILIVFGAIALLTIVGVRTGRIPPPRFLVNTSQHVLRRAMDWSPGMRAYVTGVSTTLLPCGWLYAFVGTSAGTGHPFYGMLTMFVFWLGTLPILVSVGVGATGLFTPLRKHAPVVMTIAVIGAGAWTIASRIGGPHEHHSPSQHDSDANTTQDEQAHHMDHTP